MTNWQPVPGHLMTRWAKDVDPAAPWPEYPRPQMVRHEWLNLNGLWDYAVTSLAQERPEKFNGQILVPYPLEAALSGVKRPLRPSERLWYRRSFRKPPAWAGQSILLHFGAVDWETVVWVNGSKIGIHRGGYLPFWFDITDQLEDGENELLIAVWDPTDTYWQQRGKQTLLPRSIWYTAVSGIWQTVWLEPVPQAYIAGLTITPDIDKGLVKVNITTCGDEHLLGRIRATVLDSGTPIAHAEIASAGETLILPVSNAKLWHPDSPNLYDLVIETETDRVESYFGMRKYSLGKDSLGRTRLCLNNQPLFQYGPLDQGYWPDGLYTPPTYTAMVNDLEFIKGLGCNMLRKHVKVEPASYYAFCDRIGLIVWQDMVNGGKEVSDLVSLAAILFNYQRRDRNYRYAGRDVTESRQDYQRELAEMIDHLYNFTCIGMWVPFNEGWGQFDAKQMAEWLADRDPTRLIDHASGWFEQNEGDCISRHIYFKSLPLIKPDSRRAAILSEFGGYTWNLADHAWNSAVVFGYRKYLSSQALTQAYLDLLEKQLKPLIAAGLSGAVYTQTCDVEIEMNGFLTYDREFVKMDASRLHTTHKNLG